MMLTKYFTLLFLFIAIPIIGECSYTFKVEADYINARTEWNQSSLVNQINYSSAFNLTGDAIYKFTEQIALTAGGTYASYEIETPVPVQTLSETSLSSFSFHGGGIMLLTKEIFGELVFNLDRMPYFGNGVIQTTASNILMPAIRIGIGINSKVSFGLMRVLYRYSHHLSGTFEGQSISGGTQEYRAEFYMGRNKNYGLYFKFKTSSLEGDYQLINDERSIGLVLRLEKSK